MKSYEMKRSVMKYDWMIISLTSLMVLISSLMITSNSYSINSVNECNEWTIKVYIRIDWVLIL